MIVIKKRVYVFSLMRMRIYISSSGLVIVKYNKRMMALVNFAIFTFFFDNTSL